jgi:hypothetical protein
MMQVNDKNTFNNVSQATKFKKLCDVKGPLANIIPFIGCFMLFIILIITSMGDM